MMTAHETLDRYFSIRLCVSLPDLKPGQVAVATCHGRTYQERGHGMTRLFWALHLGDRAAVSVHPAALAEVSRLAWKIAPAEVLEDEFCEKAALALQSALAEPGLRAGSQGVKLYHPGDAMPVPTDGEIRALTELDEGSWVGKREYLSAAQHPSALRGEAFGLFVDGRRIADIITHEPSVAVMAERIAEDGIEVAEDCRGRGYGKALLAHWTREMQARGRVCIHGTSAANEASIALARAVAYVEYGRTRSVSYAPPGDGREVPAS